MKRKTQNTNGKEYMVIEAKYQLGGINYFSGDSESRGIYIHFSIKEIGDGWTKETLGASSSFKILYKPLARKSQKQLEEASVWISKNADNLFDLYLALDKRALLELVQDVLLSEAA